MPPASSEFWYDLALLSLPVGAGGLCAVLVGNRTALWWVAVYYIGALVELLVGSGYFAGREGALVFCAVQFVLLSRAYESPMLRSSSEG